jgi:hypothetical protein
MLNMPKRVEDKRIEAHLSPEQFEQFKKIAQEKQWSNKKLAENVIRDFLTAQKKGKK